VVFLKTIIMVADIFICGVMLLTLTVKKNRVRKFAVPTLTFAAIFLINALIIIFTS